MKKYLLLAMTGLMVLLLGMALPALGAEKELFADDFSDAEKSSAWWSARKGAGLTATGDNFFSEMVEIADGKLTLKAPEAEEWASVILTGEAAISGEVRNFAVETRMAFKEVTDQRNAHIGVVLWTGFSERVIFMHRLRGFYSFGRTEPDLEVSLSMPFDFQPEVGKMVDVRLEMNATESGSEVVFFVNDEFIGARHFGILKDATRIGLYAYKADAEFDYFRVLALD